MAGYRLMAEVTCVELAASFIRWSEWCVTRALSIFHIIDIVVICIVCMHCSVTGVLGIGGADWNKTHLWRYQLRIASNVASVVPEVIHQAFFMCKHAI